MQAPMQANSARHLTNNITLSHCCTNRSQEHVPVNYTTPIVVRRAFWALLLQPDNPKTLQADAWQQEQMLGHRNLSCISNTQDLADTKNVRITLLHLLPLLLHLLLLV